MVVGALAMAAQVRDHHLVIAAVAALPPLDDPSWPIAAAAVADAVAVALADPGTLVSASDHLAAFARAEGCDAVAGSSSMGDTLAGAVASRFSIPLYDRSRPPARLLLVDGVLATGAAIAIAASDAINHGVSDLRGAVLVDLGATAGLAGATRVAQV